MSQNFISPPSRPPSSASSASSTSTNNNNSNSNNNLPRVHSSSYGGGHDHTRPLPPPRLPETTTSASSTTSLIIPPVTAPLTPLSTNASFRSNNSRISTSAPVGSTSTTTTTSTTTSNNNIINNNNNNNNNSTTTHHVQPSGDSSAAAAIVGNSTNSSQNTTNSTSRVSIIGSDGSRSPLGEVTLTVPRPDGDRVVNEYVETPIRQTNSTNLGQSVVIPNQKCLKTERRLHNHRNHHNHHHNNHQNHQHHQQLQHNQQQQATAHSKSGATASLVSAHARQHETADSIRRNRTNLLQSSLSATSPTALVTKQPVSFTKEPGNALGSGSLISASGRLNDPSLSIMCDFCGRCRCESCREPPPLPSRWLCDNSCFCSAETALDYASCLCCVKGLFYHCADSGSGTDSEAGGNCADEPCSCTGPRRTARWACLGALTFVLPCLLFYWPLKGCVAMCEACYARHAAQGCRCDPNSHGRHHSSGGGGGAGLGGTTSVVSRDSRDPEKRLLDPITPEL